MSKAQIEIMGLAILTLIIVATILFASRIMLNKEEIDYKKEFKEQLSSNIVEVFLRTTSNCGKLTMAELLQDCSNNNLSSRINCGILDSCSYVEKEAKEIFSNTLEEWNVNYEFKAFFDENKPLLYLGDKCYANKKAKFFPIPTEKGILIVGMSICRTTP